MNVRKGRKPSDYDPVDRRVSFDAYRDRKLPFAFTQECYVCRAKAEHWHHIVPISNGGWDVLKNLVPMCVSCHHKVHREDRFRSNRVIKGPFKSPLVTPKVLVLFVPKAGLKVR